MSKPTYGEMRTRAQRIYDDAVKDRVLSGLAVLQAEFGDEWVEKIDCALLDLSSGSRCVLAQVYGEYDEGAATLSPVEDFNKWAEQHGFYDMDNEYAGLDEAWHIVLCDREPAEVG